MTATLLVPGCASRIAPVLHALKASEAEANPDAAEPTQEEVLDALNIMAYKVRNAEGYTDARKARTLTGINQAIATYRNGAEPLPDAATLRAWQHLPAALEAERILGEPSETTETVDGAPEFRPGRDSVKPYHLAFPLISNQVKTATDDLFSARPSQLSMSDARRVFDEWLGNASAAYQLPRPTFAWDPAATFAGGGEYRPATQHIAMSKISVTTLLHEFRHHMQHQGAAMIDPDLEEDARAWSLSLYYAVRPDLLKRLVNQGRIFHITPQDFQ